MTLTCPSVVLDQVFLAFGRFLAFPLLLSAGFELFVFLVATLVLEADGQREVKKSLNKMAHLHQLLAPQTEFGTVVFIEVNC